MPLLLSLRIGPFRALDLVGTYLAVFLLAPVLTKVAIRFHLLIGRAQWLLLLLPISIVIHSIIGQQTALTKMFFDPYKYYGIKIIITGMFIMGIKNIKILSSKKK